MAVFPKPPPVGSCMNLYFTLHLFFHVIALWHVDLAGLNCYLWNSLSRMFVAPMSSREISHKNWSMDEKQWPFCSIHTCSLQCSTKHCSMCSMKGFFFFLLIIFSISWLYDNQKGDDPGRVCLKQFEVFHEPRGYKQQSILQLIIPLPPGPSLLTACLWAISSNLCSGGSFLLLIFPPWLPFPWSLAHLTQLQRQSQIWNPYRKTILLVQLPWLNPERYTPSQPSSSGHSPNPVNSVLHSNFYFNVTEDDTAIWGSHFQVSTSPSANGGSFVSVFSHGRYQVQNIVSFYQND